MNIMLMPGTDKEVEKVKSNFEAWLGASNLSEKEFLKRKIVGDFKIITQDEEEYVSVQLTYKANGIIKKIGEAFLYPKMDVEAFMDLSLILLYIAQRLDEENKKSPLLLQRKNYFFDIVKKFIAKEIQSREELMCLRNKN